MKLVSITMILTTGAVWAGSEQGGEPLPKSAFGPGEHFQFEVTMLGVLAGVAQVTVGSEMNQFGKEVWPLVSIGRTAGLASAFKVLDKFVSYYDPRAQMTVGADFVAREGSNRRNERFRYDRESSRAFVNRQWNDAPASEADYEIAEGAMDLAGLGFSIRNRQLEVGQKFEQWAFTGGSQYLLKATVERKETITTKVGTYETLVIVFNGDFSGKLKTKALISLYLSDDERHLPVRLQADIAFGSVVVDLVKFEPGRTVSGS
jgi:hypothetical protein